MYSLSNYFFDFDVDLNSRFNVTLTDDNLYLFFNLIVLNLKCLLNLLFTALTNHLQLMAAIQMYSFYCLKQFWS